MSDPVAPVSVEMVIKLDNGHVIVVELNTVRVYDISATIQREPDPDDPIGVPILGRFPTTPRWTVGAGGPGTVTVYEGVLEYESVTGNMRLGLIDEVERLKAMVDQFHEDWADLQLASQYGNPPGGAKTCLNTKLARVLLTLRRAGRPDLQLQCAQRAAFEILTDDTGHGVPVVA